MNPNSPDDWQELFDSLPVDLTADSKQSQAVKQQALQVYDEQAKSGGWKKQLSTTGNYLMTAKTPRWAATAAALILTTWFLVSTGNRPAFAMDEILETILNARTVRFVATSNTKGQQDTPPYEMKFYYAEPYKLRTEDDRHIDIQDCELGKSISLDRQRKTARVRNYEVSEEAREHCRESSFGTIQKQLAEIRKNPNANVERVGEKVIDGRKLNGYRFHKPSSTKAQSTMTVWIDPKTQLPYQIDDTSDASGTVFTMTKIEFDVKFDDSLFSVEVPKGYVELGKNGRPKQTLAVSRPSPEELLFINALEKYSVLNKKFPEKLSADSGDQFIQTTNFPGKLKQLMKTNFQKGIDFALELPTEAKAHYAGKGVSRTNLPHPIFWYWLEDEQTWRVIGADLKIRNSSTEPDVAVPIAEGEVPELP